MTNRESDKDRAEHWRIRRRHLVLQADPWLKVWSEDLTLPDGREIDEFFNVEMPDYVVIVAITADGQIVTERGYKHGPRRVCISLLAGFVEPGEDPGDAARRELLEETGFGDGDVGMLGSFINDGNRGCGTGHLYLARNARKVTDPDSGDLETVTIDLMSLDDLLEATYTGAVADLPNAAVIGLAAARLLREAASLNGSQRT